jgi:hypothetical protein
MTSEDLILYLAIGTVAVIAAALLTALEGFNFGFKSLVMFVLLLICAAMGCFWVLLNHGVTR